MLFDLNEFTPQMKDMADAIVKCAELVREAVPLLRSISAEAVRISDLTARISALEGQADELHDIGLRDAVSGRMSVAADWHSLSAMKFTIILEKVVDRFDDVANVMHGIVIEHV